MVAKGGSKLITDQAIQFMKTKLLNKVTLITPNLPEAEILTGIKINDKEDMIFAANELIKFGVPNILIKGGHLKSKKVHDIFVNKKEIKVFNNKEDMIFAANELIKFGVPNILIKGGHLKSKKVHDLSLIHI